MYSIAIDGQLVHSVENTNPLSFDNVKVFAGDPWHESFDAKMKDLVIELRTG